jgi:uncharacterized protein YjbI with pentapeptide repeats
MNYNVNDISIDAFMTLIQSNNRTNAATAIDALTKAQISKTGRGWNLSDADLSGLDCSHLNLEKAILRRTALYETNLSNSCLKGAWVSCAGMEKTNLSGVDLSGSNLHALAAQVCNFSGANLDNVVDATGGLFHGCNFTGVSARGAKLSGTSFYQTHLPQANFQGADLSRCSFTESNTTEIILCRANLTEATIQNCQMRGANLSHAHGHDLTLRNITGCDGLKLTAAHLPNLTLKRVTGHNIVANNLKADGARIEESGLKGIAMAHLNAYGLAVKDSDMSEANLHGAYLYRSHFTGTTAANMSLRGAIFTDANLVQTDMFADLTGANCARADLSYGRLNLCNLTDTNLHGSRLHETTFLKATQTPQLEPRAVFGANNRAITTRSSQPS